MTSESHLSQYPADQTGPVSGAAEEREREKRFSPVTANRLGAAGGLAAGPQRRQRPPKLYRIGEVVDYSGVSRQTIHNYATMGLIHESRWTNGGHRLFDESVFERLDRIAEMKAANKSLQQIRDHFAKMDASPAGDGPAGQEPQDMTSA
jgi:hypothetical protein